MVVSLGESRHVSWIRKGDICHGKEVERGWISGITTGKLRQSFPAGAQTYHWAIMPLGAANP